ncbi:MAG: glycosyltransferase [Flavobacteriales bacterium]|nr:glycosyltransferase [Flavobacteriales bacterium]
MNLAPIVLFVYNRPWHTKQTVEALQKNELAKESELFIYCDEAKNEDAGKSVDEVREYIDKVDGFKKVTIIKREKNWGLADSIIDGVTKIVNEYGKIIVLEDDMVTSPYFLKFMNEALEFYKDEEKVWHISGWNYPIDTDGLDDVFLWRLMNCWGWATWADKWEYFEKDIDKTISKFSKKDIMIFNLDGYELYWNQVILNKNNKINTWAVFWYATIFKQNGLCLNPSQTYVENIGHDGSGIHCGESDSYSNTLSSLKNINISCTLSENQLAFQKIQYFYKKQKKSLLVRVINKLSRIIFKRNIIK